MTRRAEGVLCTPADGGWRCDLDVRVDGEGHYVVRVATERLAGDGPVPGPDAGAAEVEAFLATCPREPIGLPYVGRTMRIRDAEAAMAVLVILDELGYRFPASLVSAVAADVAAAKRET